MLLHRCSGAFVVALALCASATLEHAAEPCDVVNDAARAKPRLTEAQVVQLATEAGRKAGYNLSKFQAPRARFCPKDGSDKWYVHFEALLRRPGAHFGVLVEDKTNRVEVVPGE